MQVIILADNAKRRMQMGNGALAMLTAAIVVMVMAAYTAGFRRGMSEAPLARNDTDFAHHAMLLHQQREVDEAKTRARFHLDQLTFHLAALKSRVEQIDAFGARLVELMGLEPAEYAFGTPVSVPPAAATLQYGTAVGSAPVVNAPVVYSPGVYSPGVNDFVADLEALGERLDAQAPKSLFKISEATAQYLQVASCPTSFRLAAHSFSTTGGFSQTMRRFARQPTSSGGRQNDPCPSV